MKVLEVVAKILNNSIVIPGNDRSNAMQEQTALDLFKDVVDRYQTTSPYSVFTTYTNQTSLQAAKYTKTQNVNVVSGNVPLPLKPLTNVDFYTSRDTVDREGLPDRYTLDAVTQKILIFPDDSSGQYKYEVLGELSFDSFTLTTELPASYPSVYIDFIILETAMRMCMMFNESKWTPLRSVAYANAKKRYMQHRKLEIPSQNRQEMTGKHMHGHLENFENQLNRG